MPQTGTINEGLDSRLLNRDQEGEAAGALKRNKISGAAKTALDMVDTSEQEEESFRELILKSRLAQEAKKKIEEQVMAPAKQFFNQALKKAWMSFTTVLGAILGYIWIHIHLLLKGIFGEQLFCKLGEEWIPMKADQASPEISKAVSKFPGTLEWVVIGFIDSIVFCIIIFIVGFFVDKDTLKNLQSDSAKQQAAVQQTK